MSINFREGEQEVSFPLSWEVVKVDQHPYYRQVSGKGMKSVDFLAIDQEWGLFFIELKDYRHRLSKDEKVDLERVFHEKLRDSKRLIQSVYAMLTQKWYYRVCLRYSIFYFLIPRRSQIWIEANELLQMGKFTYLIDIVEDHKG